MLLSVKVSLKPQFICELPKHKHPLNTEGERENTVLEKHDIRKSEVSVINLEEGLENAGHRGSSLEGWEIKLSIH